jgi:hypothetical protein
MRYLCLLLLPLLVLAPGCQKNGDTPGKPGSPKPVEAPSPNKSPAASAKPDPIEELCRAAIDPATRSDALTKLEKSAPELFEPVRAFVTAPDAYQTQPMFAKVQELGSSAKAVRPVIVWLLATRTSEAESTGSEAAMCVCLQTLAKISPAGTEEIAIIKPYCTLTATIPLQKRRKDGPTEFVFPETRATAIRSLAIIAKTHPATQSEVVKVLEPLLAGDQRGAAIDALAQCEENAKPLLGKLNAFRTGNDASVHTQADKAVKEIEAHVAAAEWLDRLAPKSIPADLTAVLLDTADDLIRRKAVYRLSQRNADIVALYTALANPKTATNDFVKSLKPPISDAPSACRLLSKSLQQATDADGRHERIKAMVRLAPLEKETDEALASYCRTVFDQDRTLRAQYSGVKRWPWDDSELAKAIAKSKTCVCALCQAAAGDGETIKINDDVFKRPINMVFIAFGKLVDADPGFSPEAAKWMRENWRWVSPGAGSREAGEAITKCNPKEAPAFLELFEAVAREAKEYRALATLVRSVYVSRRGIMSDSEEKRYREITKALKIDGPYCFDTYAEGLKATAKLQEPLILEMKRRLEKR